MAIALVLLIPATCTFAGAQTPTTRTPQDTLPLQHGPVNGRLHVNYGELRAIQIATPFRYVGGSRFILGEAADAEQHLFITADSKKTIQRLFWIQIERLLPARPGSYNYGADSTVILDGFKIIRERNNVYDGTRRVVRSSARFCFTRIRRIPYTRGCYAASTCFSA